MRDMLLALAALALGCSSASSPASDASPSAEPAASPSGAPSASAAKQSEPPPPPARYALADVPRDERDRLYAAIVDFVSSETMSVKVSGHFVTLWEDPTWDFVADVSVVRAHYAIHHYGAHFFIYHRKYLEALEARLATLGLPHAPQGKMPSWDPATPVPAPFDRVPQPRVDCFTGGDIRSRCDWEYGALADVDPKIRIPARYADGAICAFPDLEALGADVSPLQGGLHNDVHNALGGTMANMDAPAAPIFWAWHATLDDIYARYLACANEPKGG